MQTHADSFEIQYKKRSIRTSIRCMGGRTRAQTGDARITLPQEGERPLFLWNKSLPLAPLLSVQTKRGMSLSRKCHPMLRDSSFWPVLIDRDKAKSRRFSKSKSVCAGWSGKVPRYCAIWTPQCGGMKGRLCFVKRKSKDLVSN